MLDRTRPALAGVGIGMDDLAWIQRDQFVYYFILARVTHDPIDWPTFRIALFEALNAAFGLGLDPARPRHLKCMPVFDILDATRLTTDPASEWPRYMEEIWRQRHKFRDDLE